MINSKFPMDLVTCKRCGDRFMPCDIVVRKSETGAYLGAFCRACYSFRPSPQVERLNDANDIFVAVGACVKDLESGVPRGNISYGLRMAWGSLGRLVESLGSEACRESEPARPGYAAGYYACLQDLGMVPREKR